MKQCKIDSGWLVVLDRGEEVVTTLTAFCSKQNINGGFISGLGGLQTAELGYYNLTSKSYIFNEVQNAVELASLTGNVSLADGEVFLHLHAVVSDTKNQTFGGHLKKAIVGGTCEFYIVVFREPLTRLVDIETGLKLLNCE